MMAAANFIAVFLFIAFSLIIYAYVAICLQFIAQKTNQGPAWLAWVPIANLFLMCKIAKLEYYWLLILFLVFVPLIGALCVSIFFGFIWYKIAIVRNKPGWVGALGCLPFINLFVMGYLAFSD